jgi:small subunit ribosomal protein S8
MNDTIADLITRIKNASRSGKAKVLVPCSKLNLAILEVLRKEGYIQSFEEKKSKNVSRFIEVVLQYEVDGSTSRISEAKRISSPSKRIYYKATDIKPVRQGYGLLVLSTPKGILSGRDAHKEKVGGEALFIVW